MYDLDADTRLMMVGVGESVIEFNCVYNIPFKEECHYQPSKLQTYTGTDASLCEASMVQFAPP
jgi:hypothetical protein